MVIYWLHSNSSENPSAKVDVKNSQGVNNNDINDNYLDLAR